MSWRGYEWVGHPDDKPRGSGNRARNAAIAQARIMGPPKPEPLVTLQAARLRRLILHIHCAPCRRHQQVESWRLPERARSVALGELWLAGKFRCAGCRGPATWLEVIARDQTDVCLERWEVGGTLAVERLRRHWRWDAYDRRDWKAWFGRV